MSWVQYTSDIPSLVDNKGLTWAKNGGAGPKTEASDLKKIAGAIAELEGFTSYSGTAHVAFIRTSTGHWYVGCSGAAIGSSLAAEMKECINAVVPTAQQAGWTVLTTVEILKDFKTIVDKIKSPSIIGSDGTSLGCAEKKLLSYLHQNSLGAEPKTLSTFRVSGAKSEWVYPCMSCAYCIAYYSNTLCKKATVSS